MSCYWYCKIPESIRRYQQICRYSCYALCPTFYRIKWCDFETL